MKKKVNIKPDDEKTASYVYFISIQRFESQDNLIKFMLYIKVQIMFHYASEQ